MQSTTNSTRTFMTPHPKKDEPVPKKKRQLPKLKLSPWLVVLLLVVFGIFMVVQYQAAKRKLQAKPAATNTRQVTDVITKVRKLIILPSNETPTVATVKDADKLKDQSFFKDAHNGDTVLIFSKEKEAILYRSATNQIVTVSPVTLSPNGNAQLPQ